MLQYTCIKDYMKNPDNVERAWCIVGGEWVGPKLTCQGKDCKNHARRDEIQEFS
jgi:hypothetical protein